MEEQHEASQYDESVWDGDVEIIEVHPHHEPDEGGQDERGGQALQVEQRLVILPERVRCNYCVVRLTVIILHIKMYPRHSGFEVCWNMYGQAMIPTSTLLFYIYRLIP